MRQSLFGVLLEAILRRVEVRLSQEGLEHPAGDEATAVTALPQPQRDRDPAILPHAAMSPERYLPAPTRHAMAPSCLPSAATASVSKSLLYRWVAAALHESEVDFPGLLQPYVIIGQEGFALALR